jgi:hypothetical protein
MTGHGFGFSARWWAEQVDEGNVSREQAERSLGLKPGERLAANGVISGSGADPDVPRFGADENDLDDITE